MCRREEIVDTTPQGRLTDIFIKPVNVISQSQNSQLPVNNGSLLEDPADTVNRQINTFRSCLAAAEPHVYFFNATDLFLADNDHINTTLYREDFIHPHTPGYLVWGKAMADYIDQLLFREV